MRFAHSQASKAGLPGSGELRHSSNCGKLLVIHVAQHPPAAGPGWGSHPGGVWGKAPSHPPRPIPVFQGTAFIRFQHHFSRATNFLVSYRLTAGKLDKDETFRRWGL